MLAQSLCISWASCVMSSAWSVGVSQVEQLESQNRQVRKDFKEMKIREARTMSDYSELEEENVTLQKQLAGLKQTQVWQLGFSYVPYLLIL